MNRAPHRRLMAVAALASGMALSCGSSDTTVLVEVDVLGALPRAVFQLLVEARVGGDSGEKKDFRVPSSVNDALTFPTSFSMQIPRSKAGELKLTVIGRDETNVEVVSGTAMIDLEVGTLNNVRVLMMGKAEPPRPDAAPDTASPMTDASVDAPRDASPDAGVDAPDAAIAPDAADASPEDAPVDAGIDAPEDVGIDAPDDAGIDAPEDAGVDTPDAREQGKQDAGPG